MRIEKLFETLKQQNKQALSPYLTAGFPNTSWTLELMHALVEGGADIIELGIPFSDPMAEGPTIQRAMEVALEQKTTLDKIFELVKAFRQSNQHTPIILMGYANPIENKGYEAFAQDAHDAGVDGTIIVDLPPEEAQVLDAIWKQYGLAAIFLCSPTTTDERYSKIAALAQGYIYYVSLKGVTGANNLDVDSVKRGYLQCKQKFNLPVLVGFGIKSPERAAAIAEFSDGVVVGAALIETIMKHVQDKAKALKACRNFIANMRQAIDKQAV